jgi:Cu+-exporting ATPase
MGHGSDLTMSTAKFILVSSNLTSILTLLELSRKVIRRIKFNFVWSGCPPVKLTHRAVVYNMIAIPIAAGTCPLVLINCRHPVPCLPLQIEPGLGQLSKCTPQCIR